MKISKILLQVLFLVVFTTSLKAQVKVDINLGTPPSWGPAVSTEQYYFLPDIETYYDIRNSEYLYRNHGQWVRSRNVPKRYGNYNFNTGQVIVLKDYKGRSPYINFKNHKIKYINKKNDYKSHNDNNKGNVVYRDAGKNKKQSKPGHKVKK